MVLHRIGGYHPACPYILLNWCILWTCVICWTVALCDRVADHLEAADRRIPSLLHCRPYPDRSTTSLSAIHISPIPNKHPDPPRFHQFTGQSTIIKKRNTPLRNITKPHFQRQQIHQENTASVTIIATPFWIPQDWTTFLPRLSKKRRKKERK